MMKSFPLILAAVKRGETGYYWQVGDAIVAEIGPPDPSQAGQGKLSAVSKYLLDNGYEYSVSYLNSLYVTAYNFPAKDRNIPGISYRAYRKSRSPETLRSIIAGAPRGTKITGDFCESVLQGQYEEQQAERRHAAEKARIAREKAEAKEVAARQRIAEAADREEKAKAEKKARQAAAQAQEARQKEKAVKVAPVKKTGPVKEEEVPAMVAKATVLANASSAQRLAAEAKKAIAPHIGGLSPAMAAGMIEAALETVNSWRELAEAIQGQKGEREHLSVVGE